MKSEKGITLISLTIYIIVMSIVVAIVAIISTYFYTNMNGTNENIDPIVEYTRFNSFFSDEVNHQNLKVLVCAKDEETNQDYIVFSNGVQYTYVPENRAIYKNQVKIARNIESCTFKEEMKNGKNAIIVDMKAGNKERSTTYTLKN